MCGRLHVWSATCVVGYMHGQLHCVVCVVDYMCGLPHVWLATCVEMSISVNNSLLIYQIPLAEVDHVLLLEALTGRMLP